ncbi:adenosylcobinamide-phosphate synthase CbiB [Cognatiyoonia koreensis]|uniref:adenosylcobinamide-phosphate synthase CbiB n=1 Tax=Cognatiyoonia koreensis TaxID=364200 RepID=UPI000AAA1937
MTLVIAMILDAAFGEPKWIWSRVPHPAVLMGRLIGWIDETYNVGSHRFEKGFIAMVCLATGAVLIGLGLRQIPFVDVIVLAILLAQRSLVEHVSAVAMGLRVSLKEGKRAVAMIVSRDTANMTESDVSRSAIESAAENMSDGVIAPIFWFAIAGLPGLLLYKITNTADSMIGYRTPRHEKFGKAAARLDDLLNIIPARLTALMMWAVTPHSNLAGIRRDAPAHRSPNAGWPEAAMAYGHQIALSGPRSYDGQIREFAYVNAAGRTDLGPNDIMAAVSTLWKTWGLALCLAVVLWLTTGLL